MYVRFDLRTPEYREIERKAHTFNVLRLIAIALLTAFIVTSVGYSAMAFLKLQGLKSDIEQKELEVSNVEASRMAMVNEIANLRRQEQDYRRSLRIMQNEPATLEALDAIEKNMGPSPGVSLSTVRFVPVSGGRANTANDTTTIAYSVTVEGSAMSEGQITSLMEGLRLSGVFSSVVMPSSQRGNSGPVNFTLVLNLLPVGQI